MDCIILLKRSLIYIDNILPLIMELKKASLISKPLFIAMNKEAYEVIRSNVVLYDAIYAIGGRIEYINKFSNPLFRNFHNLYVMRSFLLRRVISFDFSPKYSNLYLYLCKLNRILWKGKNIYVSLFNTPYKQLMNLREMRILLRDEQHKRNKKRIIKNFDYLLLSHSKKQIEEANALEIDPLIPTINVGYSRGLADWNMYLINNRDKYFPKEIKKPYFLYILGGFGKGLEEEDRGPWEDWFVESLWTIKKYNNDLFTVFKPKDLNSASKIEEILKQVKYKNYIFSYIHPFILFKNAKFIFDSCSSTLSADAYFHKKPVIEFRQYDSRVLKMLKNRSWLLNLVDYFIPGDVNELDNVFNYLVYHNIDIKRINSDIEKDFPVLSQNDVKKKFQFLK